MDFCTHQGHILGKILIIMSIDFNIVFFQLNFYKYDRKSHSCMKLVIRGFILDPQLYSIIIVLDLFR